MNTKYFLYALALTLVTTVLNWSNALNSLSSARHSGSGWSSSSGGSSYGGGGGHK
jgi:uncharacterized membrane protein YgcG